MHSKTLFIFTRTPLHVGAGSSVGAIDQPIQRERHTGLPVIPASSQKGVFADEWNASLTNSKRVAVVPDAVPEASSEAAPAPAAENTTTPAPTITAAAWLFGSDSDKIPFAGSLLFSEARLLAFPIRSAKGSHAWITSPMLLQRAARDGVFAPELKSQILKNLAEPAEDEAIYEGERLNLNGQVVLEEFCLAQAKESSEARALPRQLPTGLAAALAALVADDDLFATVTERLVILSNGTMSHFANCACEVAQHVRISDETGTAETGGLFNQENVPADTLFYATLSAVPSRVPSGEFRGKSPEACLEEVAKKLKTSPVLQFGGDATTGLGFCSVTLHPLKS